LNWAAGVAENLGTIATVDKGGSAVMTAPEISSALSHADPVEPWAG
jgi:hypothetical protein